MGETLRVAVVVIRQTEMVPEVVGMMEIGRLGGQSSTVQLFNTVLLAAAIQVVALVAQVLARVVTTRRQV